MKQMLAIIAGQGQLPFAVSAAAKNKGLAVLGIGIKGWVDGALSEKVDSYQELSVGQLGDLIKTLKVHQANQVVMAGKVTKEVLLSQQHAFDEEMRRILTQAKDFSVTGVLGAIGQRLAQEGIQLLDSSLLLQDALCPIGQVTARGPSQPQEEDIRLGVSAARSLAALDVGQTVIVCNKVVIAVEALEGTDAAIRRAYELAGSGLVVVKMAAVHQDRRFDLPIVGLQTIKTLRACGIACLAVQANSTLLLDRSSLIAEADAAGIVIVGVS